MVEGATLVTVLRHGAVDGRPHVYRGALDPAMIESATHYLHGLAQRLGNPVFDRIASSPLRRCRDFAREFAASQGVPLQVLEAFREMSFGDWEGLTPGEVAERDPDAHRRFRESAGVCAPPGGESVGQLRERVRAGWMTWMADADGGHRLLVTHAGVMRALLMELCELPPAMIHRLALPETASFRLSWLPGSAPVLLNLNPCAA